MVMSIIASVYAAYVFYRFAVLGVTWAVVLTHNESTVSTRYPPE